MLKIIKKAILMSIIFSAGIMLSITPNDTSRLIGFILEVIGVLGLALIVGVWFDSSNKKGER